MSFESAMTCTVLYAQHPEQAPWLYSGPMSMRERQSRSEGRSISSGRTVVIPPSDAEARGRETSNSKTFDDDAPSSALRSRANAAAASAARSSSSDKSASSAASAPSVASSFASLSVSGSSSPRLARPVLHPSAASVAAKNFSAELASLFSVFPSSARRGASAVPEPSPPSPLSLSSFLGATLTVAAYVAWFAANSSGVRSAKRVTIFFIPPAPFSARAALCCSMWRMLRSRMISRR
mmetsp:Transcript_6187/g.26282  ORF Transcript_6187/g.26282 Transcript_6187/m.26282 type:complete len:237 (-) Transcript_6187:1040-1750(-)